MLVSISVMALHSSSVTDDAVPSTPGSAFSVVGTGVELFARADAMLGGLRAASWRCSERRKSLRVADGGASLDVGLRDWRQGGPCVGLTD
jgi:hypothetical protein